jgi:hypothetical protein
VFICVSTINTRSSRCKQTNKQTNKQVSMMSIVDVIEHVHNSTPWIPKGAHFLNLRPLYFLEWMHRNPMRLCADDRLIWADEDLVYYGDPFDIYKETPDKSLCV